MPPQDFVDDDFYDPDEAEYEEELSAEDKAAMESGTVAVRKDLGDDASKVTLDQIHEALWHYYYDIEKSVAYLRKTFVAPPPKPAAKKAPEGKSREFSFASSFEFLPSAGGADSGVEEGWWLELSSMKTLLESTRPLCRSSTSMNHFFSDMPWMNTPAHRHATFTPPSLPSGGLLGGSEGTPKMSKLQALAAARRKKNEEKKGSDKTTEAESDLKKLSIAESSKKENRPPTMTQSQNANSKTRDQPSGRISDQSPQPSEASVTTQSNPTLESKKMSEEVPFVVEDRTTATQLSPPSAFARTLLGSAPEAQRAQRQDVFAIPYTSSSSFSAGVFAKPSPDDIVFAAQAKAGKKTSTTPKVTKKTPKETASKEGSDAGDLSNSVSNLKVNDIPPPKSKGIDVLKEFEKTATKRSTSFVVVGHVDAGKSTLMGRLLVELKYVEQRTVDKYRRQAEKSGKQSFALAWVMDQRSEERERGVTIDIATNYFETEQTKFTILDAPGHKDFVPNMIAGASQADFAILVIDANTGAYEKGLKGQTREHVLLLRSLGLQRVIVAVNKLDMVGWSKDRFEEITQEVTGFLNGLGFQSKNVDFVPISGLNGENIVRKITDSAADWYQGKTLLGALEDSESTSARALKKPFRLAISEIFRSQQGTTTLAGRIDAGTTQLGEVVAVQPSGETAYIKSIMVDKDSQDWAVAGQNVTIGLTDIDPIHIRVGDILCPATDPITCGDLFTMKAMAFEHLMPMPIDLHRGRLHAPGHIQSIAATLDKATGNIIKKKPKVVQPGGVARILIKLEEKVPLEAGQRVVIRSGGETIAAGLLE